MTSYPSDCPNCKNLLSGPVRHCPICGARQEAQLSGAPTPHTAEVARPKFVEPTDHSASKDATLPVPDPVLVGSDKPKRSIPESISVRPTPRPFNPFPWIALVLIGVAVWLLLPRDDEWPTGAVEKPTNVVEGEVAVLDTANLIVNGTPVLLGSVVPETTPEFVAQLSSYLAGKSLRCEELKPASGAYRCVEPNGKDIAEVALQNGVATAEPSAPVAYLEAEKHARTECYGRWAGPCEKD